MDPRMQDIDDDSWCSSRFRAIGRSVRAQEQGREENGNKDARRSEAQKAFLQQEAWIDYIMNKNRFCRPGRDNLG